MSYHCPMTLKSIMLQFSEEQIEQLDRAAKHSGASRSQVVRDAVDALLAPKPDADVAALYAAAYPSGSFGTDEWGDLDAWHDAIERQRVATDRGAW